MRTATIIIALTFALGTTVSAAEGSAWKWEETVAKIEANNATAEKGAVVFVGSSSIASWGTLPKDFPGFVVLKRGFGGSVVADQLKAVARIVTPISPRVVGYYCGDNDIKDASSNPQVAVDGFVAWLDVVQQALPDTEVLYLAIKPSPKREAAWPVAMQANEAIKAICNQRKRTTYVDVASVLLTADGSMRPELYKEDRLHLNADGYALWVPAIRLALEKAWAASEVKP